MKIILKSSVVIFFYFLLATIAFPQDSLEVLSQKVIEAYNKGQFKEAIVLSQELIKLIEEKHGKAHRYLATPLDNMAHAHKVLGNYEQADSIYHRALKIRKKEFGLQSIEAAISLNNIAELYRQIQKCAQADSLHRRALSIREDSLGTEDTLVAESLNNLALTRVCLRELSGVENLYQRALQIIINARGLKHLQVAFVKNNLAEYYRFTEQYKKAIPLYNHSIDIKSEIINPNHPSVANSMTNLAATYAALGEYAKAEPLYLQALEIRIKFYNPNHPEVANSLDHLAAFYYSTGNYEQAEKYYKKAKETWTQIFGDVHPDLANSLNNLAVLYHKLGKYPEADSLYHRALFIRKKIFGPSHPEVANSLNSIGIFYAHIGKYKQAESYLKQALTIRKEYYSQNHTSVATSNENLALLYHHLKKYAEAESLYTITLNIREKVLDSNHPDVANTRNNLAVVYVKQKLYEKAESIYNQALSIFEKSLGPNHPNVATTLNNLSVPYINQGKYLRADSLCQRALAIWEGNLGANHPNISACLNNLAIIHAALHSPEKALSFLERALFIDEHTIDNVFHLTSEREKFAFLNTVAFRFEIFQNLVLQTLKLNPDAVHKSLNATFRRKGLVLDALSNERTSLLSSKDESVATSFAQYQKILERLANLILKGAGDSSSDNYRYRFEKLQAEKDSLETQLAKLSHRFQRYKKTRQIDLSHVAESLAPESVLIEYLIIRLYNFETKEWGKYHYLAYVLNANNLTKPVLIDLGEAVPIDKAIREFRTEMALVLKIIKNNKSSESDAEQKLAVKSRHLYDLVFYPLEKFIGKSTNLYVSPDGELNLIPFGVLKDNNENYLLNKYQFNYISCGKELVKTQEDTVLGEGVIIMADPDYNADIMSSKQTDKNSRSIGAAALDTLRTFNWQPLSETEKEAAAISDTLAEKNPVSYLGIDASEDEFKKLHAPEILHISTHGFFLEDVDKSRLYEQDEFLQSVQVTDKTIMDFLSQIENPLLRSGLALAGANRFGEEKSNESSEDGILTALEISGMNFWGTDLVVLSACESGLGDIRRGEGVFGLRRAFQLAGAKTIVMSLWKVSDEETRKLMVHFYRLINEGEGKAQALQNAQLELMKSRRNKEGAAHPFYWGAFICAGEP